MLPPHPSVILGLTKTTGEVLIPCRPMKTTLRELTPKQRAFADALLEGLASSKAYRRAYPAKGSPKLVSVKAAEVKRHPAVQAYMREQQSKLDRAKGLTRTRKRQFLYEVVMNPDSSTADKLRAIELDNRMTGDNIPEKVEAFGLSDLLTMMRQRSTNTLTAPAP